MVRTVSSLGLNAYRLWILMLQMLRIASLFARNEFSLTKYLKKKWENYYHLQTYEKNKCKFFSYRLDNGSCQLLPETGGSKPWVHDKNVIHGPRICPTGDEESSLNYNIWHYYLYLICNVLQIMLDTKLNMLMQTWDQLWEHRTAQKIAWCNMRFYQLFSAPIWLILD